MKKGRKVVIADFNSVEGQKTADQIGGEFLKVDVRSWKQQYEAFDKTFKHYGKIDFGEAG